MAAEPLVIRDDLSKRTVLSKSALTSFDWCPTAAWHDIHYRLPIMPAERLTFGSAIDAAVEQMVVALRAGVPVEMARTMAAVDEVLAREDTGVDRDEVERGAELWMLQVAGKYDFAFARTQPRIEVTFPDLGDVSTHPDIVLRDNTVYDVKTARKAKVPDPSLELGFYALCVELETAKPVERVGYWTYVRVTRPYWQILEYPVTSELRRWTRERAGAFVRAKKADEVLNRKSAEPRNYSFTGGPRFASKCQECQYAPANGGPCPIAYEEEIPA